jgi:hypothetical protein
MVLADSGRIARVPPYLGTPQGDYGRFRLRGCHPVSPAFPGRSATIQAAHYTASPGLRLWCPATPEEVAFLRFGLSPVRSPLLGGSLICFIFLRVLRCFTSPGLPPPVMYSPTDTPTFAGVGFPIQKSTDQSLIGGSPWLIAATHVFHRLLKPRHPPYALCSLDI